jgi:hypothetical protein
LSSLFVGHSPTRPSLLFLLSNFYIFTTFCILLSNLFLPGGGSGVLTFSHPLVSYPPYSSDTRPLGHLSSFFSQTSISSLPSTSYYQTSSCQEAVPGCSHLAPARVLSSLFVGHSPTRPSLLFLL